MRIQTTILAAALAAMAAPARANAVDSAQRKIMICTDDGEAYQVASQAQSLASEMFAGIGVTVKWSRSLRSCPSEAIRISVAGRTPEGLSPGALAFALPYEGKHIRVFYDRIVQNHSKADVPMVLAHVFVHEITHILQGISRHSESGVMKAHWGPKDFTAMSWKPLSFTKGDIDLIYSGLAARERGIRRDDVALLALQVSSGANTTPDAPK